MERSEVERLLRNAPRKRNPKNRGEMRVSRRDILHGIPEEQHATVDRIARETGAWVETLKHERNNLRPGRRGANPFYETFYVLPAEWFGDD